MISISFCSSTQYDAKTTEIDYRVFKPSSSRTIWMSKRFNEIFFWVGQAFLSSCEPHGGIDRIVDSQQTEKTVESFHRLVTFNVDIPYNDACSRQRMAREC
jgi:hypothetical protein